MHLSCSKTSSTGMCSCNAMALLASNQSFNLMGARRGEAGLKRTHQVDGFVADGVHAEGLHRGESVDGMEVARRAPAEGNIRRREVDGDDREEWGMRSSAIGHRAWLHSIEVDLALLAASV